MSSDCPHTGRPPREEPVVPHTETRCPSHGHLGTQGCPSCGRLTGSCIERARRAWRGTGTPRPWRAGGCGGTLGTDGGSVGGRGLSPSPQGRGVAPAPTLAHAGQGQRELPHEVVAGGAVVVLHHKTHQGQLGHPHLEPQRLLPARVETCGSGKRGGCGHRGHWSHQGRSVPHRDQQDSRALPLPRLSCCPALGQAGGVGVMLGPQWGVLGKRGPCWSCGREYWGGWRPESC